MYSHLAESRSSNREVLCFMNSEPDGTPQKDACPAQRICSFRTICAVCADPASNPLQPHFDDVEKGEIFVTNPNAEGYLYVMQSGFFGVFGEAELGSEVPFAIFNAGVAAGAAELYAPQRVRDAYDIRCLISGRICSFRADEVTEKLKTFSRAYAQRIVCCALMNQFNSVFALMIIRGKTYIYDQIVTMLMFLKEFSNEEDAREITFEITQEEIALLISANRMAVSRVLHKMKDDGVIDYSYKSITLFIDELPDISYGFTARYLAVEDEDDYLSSFEGDLPLLPQGAPLPF